MKKKIGIAGNILVDVVKMIDCWPQKGMLTNIGRLSRSTGGCVCNTGIDIARLDADVQVSAYGKVGSDDYGAWVIDRMSAENVDVTGIKRANDLPTSFTDVMTLPDGERTFFHARGANAAFGLNDLDVETLNCDLFHLGYLSLLDELDKPDSEYGTRSARLLSNVRARGIETSIDLVSDQTGQFGKAVLPALPFCDYAVINEIEGGLLTGIPARGADGTPDPNALRGICETILQKGVRKKAVVHYPEGSCCLDADGTFTALPSLSLPKGYIVGAVGAGDAFCAGMLYSFLYGMDAETGMRLASCAAACNLSAADSTGGAKNLGDTLTLEKLYFRRSY